MNDFERAQHILIVGGLFSAAKYLFGEDQFSPRALAANLVMAMAIGWIGVLIAEWLDLTAGQVGIIVGGLSWLGPTAVTTAAKRMLRQWVKDDKFPTV